MSENEQHVTDYMAGLSDDDLLREIEEAKQSLQEAAEMESSGEWHESCFAGALVLAMEAQKRGLITSTIH